MAKKTKIREIIEREQKHLEELENQRKLQQVKDLNFVMGYRACLANIELYEEQGIGHQEEQK